MTYTMRGFWGSNWNVDEDGLRDELEEWENNRTILRHLCRE